MFSFLFSGYYFDNMIAELLFILPAAIFAIWASARVNSSFNKYSSVMSRRGITGAQAAQAILTAAGVHDVRVEYVSGNLSDHFDPKAGVIRLSESVYSSSSVAALGVAAHEAGHAIQYAHSYGPIKLRAAIIPVTQVASNIALPLILLGFIFQIGFLVPFGIICFSAAALFQLITLPVEFNASKRALEMLDGQNILYDDELAGAKKVLSAAAMTYVAALASALASLLRIIFIFGRRND